MSDRLLTVKEVADRLQCSTKHVRRLTWAHEIEHLRVGQLLRYRESAVEAYLEKATVAAR